LHTTVFAFQRCLNPTNCFSSSQNRFTKETSYPINFSLDQRTKSQTRIAGSPGNEFETENESPLNKIKAHIKSYQKDYDAELAKRKVLKRMEPYVKYPFRFVRNYFRGEKQEEIDAFNDIIVSDEVSTNAEDYMRESSFSESNGNEGQKMISLTEGIVST
jgi:hypothetical protein